jgi:trimethylamine--corrinoid protein Co-methyltransferase
MGEEEIERIHRTSLRILAEVGISVHSDDVRRSLMDYGASASADGRRVLISEDVVGSALSSAPRSLLLAGRVPDHDLRIPSGTRGPYVANGGEGVYVRDLVTGEQRPSSAEDLSRFANLVDRLPQVDFFWPMVGAIEQPPHVKEVMEFKVCLDSTSKHIQIGAISATQAEKMVAIGSAVLGGPEELAKRPVFSVVQCPISPLTFEKGLVEAQAVFARAGVPVIAMSASVAGLSSPVTIAGTLAQINAENMASLVISQASQEGAPFVYGSDSSPGDLTTGSIDYGALESPLFRAAAGQMADRYSLPKMVAGIGIENMSLPLGNLWEGVHFMMTQGLVDSDLASGFGGIDQASGASLEQLLLDAWIWDVAKQLVREIDFDDTAIAYETIKQASLDKDFLGKRHTMSNFKKASAAVTHPAATMKERLRRSERGALLRRAKEEVGRILSAPPNRLLSGQESAEIDEIISS